MIAAAPSRPGYRAPLATELGVPVGRTAVADDGRMHTAALVAALDRGTEELPPGSRVLLVAADAGATAVAALCEVAVLRSKGLVRVGQAVYRPVVEAPHLGPMALPVAVARH